MLKEVTEKDFINKSLGVSSDLLAQSYNKHTTLSENTKLVIVGTLTPPNTAYFYCSFYNRIYGYIDEALERLNRSGEHILKELKRGLSKVDNKHAKIDLLPQKEIDKRVELIKQILSKNGIAFLDVMDKAIRKKISSYDDDIVYYTLAINDFHNINPTATIIANSKLANECAVKIGVKNLVYLSQRFDKKDKWVETIIKAIK